MTSKVLEIGKKLLGRAPALPNRGEIAVQEQMSIFRHALVTARKPHVPRTRGEIAVHEQARIIRETLYRSIQPGEPKTRGEVATQEQKSIFRQAAGTLTAETDAIQAFPTQKETDAIQAFPTQKETDAIQAFPTQKETDAIQAFPTQKETGIHIRQERECESYQVGTHRCSLKTAAAEVNRKHLI